MTNVTTNIESESLIAGERYCRTWHPIVIPRPIQILLLLLFFLPSAQSAGIAGNSKDLGTIAASGSPAECMTTHGIGNLLLTVTNYGQIGTSTFKTPGAVDCFTGQSAISCEFPKGSGTRYLFAGALWVGAVVGRDTLVSIGNDGLWMDHEFHSGGCCGDRHYIPRIRILTWQYRRKTL
jgi:hypothetical protein